MANVSYRRRLLALLFLFGAGLASTAAFLFTRADSAKDELTLQVSPFPHGFRELPTIERTNEHTYDGAGSGSVHARTPAGARVVNKYARAVIHPINWRAGTDIWYGCAFFLPNGFYEAQQGQVDLMRWDNFDVDATTTDRGGVVIYGDPELSRAYLIRAQLHGDQEELVGPFAIGEGAWHWLEVHQRYTVGNTADLSELYLDGKLVGRSTDPNWYGRPITAMRFGLVATSGTQSLGLELWLDRITVSGAETGPLAESGS